LRATCTFQNPTWPLSHASRGPLWRGEIRQRLFRRSLQCAVFFIVGLAGSALLNLLFGFGSTVAFFGIVWMLNGWFQGMGFPPCARLLTHWFPPKQLATKMSIWNTSHCIGAIVILLLGAALVTISWRLVFLVPAAKPSYARCYSGSRFRYAPIGRFAGSRRDRIRLGRRRLVFAAGLLQQIHLARLTGQFLRLHGPLCSLRLGPTMLGEFKHISITNAAWMLAGFEGSRPWRDCRRLAYGQMVWRTADAGRPVFYGALGRLAPAVLEV
jgi:hypothetical protein